MENVSLFKVSSDACAMMYDNPDVISWADISCEVDSGPTSSYQYLCKGIYKGKFCDQIIIIRFENIFNLTIASFIGLYLSTLDPCNDIECIIKNEICDISDGVCKCGVQKSCENMPWSPTCNILTGSCSCGSNPPCNKETEFCDEVNSKCIQEEGEICFHNKY